jgi:large subunit ribosomal protein L35
MSKMKTKRAAAKRLKVTGNGKIKIKKANLRHILTKKSRNLKRSKRKPGILNNTDGANMRKLIPYA